MFGVVSFDILNLLLSYRWLLSEAMFGGSANLAGVFIEGFEELLACCRSSI
jgi:hypothetical protein